MNLLNKLTKKNLLLNKKRTIVTIIGIILSVALITALSSLVESFKMSSLVYEKTRAGNYHVSFDHVLSNDVEKIRSNRYIEDVYFTKSIGYAKLDGIKNESKPYVFISAFDFKALENLGLNIIEGRLPQTSKEIVIPRHLKSNGRVELKVGDKINLGIGKRLAGEELLNQDNPYQEGVEKFLKEYDKEYTIVGIIERPSYTIEQYSAPGYTFITCLDDTSESLYSAFIRYKHKYLSDYYGATADILGIDKEIFKKGLTGFSTESQEEILSFYETYNKEMEKARYNFRSINSYLISLEYQNMEDPSMQALYMVAAIVVIIIMVTSVFCIRNSFNISITEKTKQYGMLASVGATKKQIKHNVLYEAFILGLIGIPIGILSGILAAFILIKIASFLLMDSLNIDLSFAVSIASIILSIMLSIITIYFSAIRSAKKASRISPISAIRNNDDIKIKSKKVKSPKIIKKIFGVGGDISYKNLKRNRKKYRTTVISIVVCVSIFIALYSFMDLAFRTVRIQFNDINYNITMSINSNEEENAKSLINQILDLDGINDYSIVNSLEYNLYSPKYTKKYNEHRSRTYVDDEERYSAQLFSLGEYQYNKYLKELGLKYEDVKDKIIIINNSYVYEYDEEKDITKKVDIELLEYNVGDIIKGSYYNSESCKEGVRNSCYIEKELTVGAVVKTRPLGVEDMYTSDPHFIISDELMNKISKYDGFNELYFDVENPDKFQDEAEKILNNVSDFHITNFDKEMKQMKSLFTLIAIFLYGFITVIALIGITNIFNTITTNMELRAREFATLKSVGMTKREFNRMVSLESLFYGTKSLIIGIPIGIVLSYLIYKALMNGSVEFKYNLPIMAIIICIVAVLLLITVIMKYSINKISKQNTIETIRNDNI